jgi:phosphoribosyl 1,2-cyclic phosphodiesterase
LADQPSPISSDDCPPTQRIKRFVANVNWIEISPFIAFEPVEGFRMLPLPVMHGEDLICMGYIFGGRERVCYLSDVSRVLPETLKILEDSRIDLLIVDSLHYEIKNPVHFSVFDAIELCRQLKPKRTFLIGMAATIDHDEMNEALYALKRSEGLDIQLAYDGLSIQVAL